MARSFLIFNICMILNLGLTLKSAHKVFAQDKEALFKAELLLKKNKVLSLLTELSEIKTDPILQFEEKFDKTIKMIENALEEQKLYCSGDSSGEQGEVIAKSQKQSCVRELKKTYLKVTEETFIVKKKYLMALHKTQLDHLEANKKRALLEIEANF